MRHFPQLVDTSLLRQSRHVHCTFCSDIDQTDVCIAHHLLYKCWLTLLLRNFICIHLPPKLRKNTINSFHSIRNWNWFYHLVSKWRTFCKRRRRISTTDNFYGVQFQDELDSVSHIAYNQWHENKNTATFHKLKYLTINGLHKINFLA